MDPTTSKNANPLSSFVEAVASAKCEYTLLSGRKFIITIDGKEERISKKKIIALFFEIRNREAKNLETLTKNTAVLIDRINILFDVKTFHKELTELERKSYETLSCLGVKRPHYLKILKVALFIKRLVNIGKKENIDRIEHYKSQIPRLLQDIHKELSGIRKQLQINLSVAEEKWVKEQARLTKQTRYEGMALREQWMKIDEDIAALEKKKEGLSFKIDDQLRKILLEEEIFLLQEEKEKLQSDQNIEKCLQKITELEESKKEKTSLFSSHEIEEIDREIKKVEAQLERSAKMDEHKKEKLYKEVQSLEEIIGEYAREIASIDAEFVRMAEASPDKAPFQPPAFTLTDEEKKILQIEELKDIKEIADKLTEVIEGKAAPESLFGITSDQDLHQRRLQIRCMHRLLHPDKIKDKVATLLLEQDRTVAKEAIEKIFHAVKEYGSQIEVGKAGKEEHVVSTPPILALED